MKTNPVGTFLILATTTLLPVAVPTEGRAQVSVGVGIDIHIPLPPPIVFAAPPAVVVLPGSNIYVAPDVPEDVFFVDGWWWRPWQGRWYRSQSYDGGWAYYAQVPSFYPNVRRDWRDSYHRRQWDGHPWEYKRIPPGQLKKSQPGPPAHAGPPPHAEGHHASPAGKSHGKGHSKGKH